MGLVGPLTVRPVSGVCASVRSSPLPPSLGRRVREEAFGAAAFLAVAFRALDLGAAAFREVVLPARLFCPVEGRALVFLALVFRALAVRVPALRAPVFRPPVFRPPAFRAPAFRAPAVFRPAVELFLPAAPGRRDAADRERVLPARLREAEGDLRAAGFLAICVCPSTSVLPRLTVRP
jgi:hypothetical protein